MSREKKAGNPPPAPKTGGERVLLPKQTRQMQDLVASLLDSSGNQREYLISVLLSQVSPSSLSEPSYKAVRALNSALIKQLITSLRAGRSVPLSTVLEFCKYINLFPLERPSQFHAALQTAFTHATEHTQEQYQQLEEVELLSLLAALDDVPTSVLSLEELESRSAPANSCLHIVHQFSLAKLMAQNGKLRDFTSLWLRLASDVYQQEGAEAAMFILLNWIKMLDWGNRTATKKLLLLKFGATLKNAGNLLSAILLYELFSLEDKLVSPPEKMHYARQLLKLPGILLNPQQQQHVYFFAGNYYSGMQLNIRQSIRYYQHSNYYLHRAWIHLQSLSGFLREKLPPLKYTAVSPQLERRVIDLESQMSLQNNAYVETLHANYDQIRELYRKVEELSVTDKLTGLRNRRFLSDNTHYLFQLAARHKASICFGMLDIDHFKLVNDAHGHLAGDQVLKSCARMLAKGYRRSDLIIRYGGEEFLLVFFDTNQEQFCHLMDDLRKKLAAHTFTYKGVPIRITVSIGVTCETAPCLTEKALHACVERADAAMYQAKNGGRNRVVAYQA